MKHLIPEKIRLNKKNNCLELKYVDTGEEQPFKLAAEYLRVYSPSAEVRGHGNAQATLQAGKKYIKLMDLSIVGNYALKLVFDDGHDSGLYTWSYLHELCTKETEYWQTYLEKLKSTALSRDPNESIVRFI